MKKITKKMISMLQVKFYNYKDRAEQHEFPLLLQIDYKLGKTWEKIAKDKNYIKENQEDLNAMFRVILRTIGEDYSEYIEEKTEEELKTIEDYKKWALAQIEEIKDDALRAEVVKRYQYSLKILNEEGELASYAIRKIKQYWERMVEVCKEQLYPAPPREKEKDLEYEVYRDMCAGCEKERYCHNNCETCEEYQDELERRINGN